MFDWNAELEAAKHRVAELEELVCRLKDALRQSASDATDATPLDRILERSRRTLSVRMASLERAATYSGFRLRSPSGPKFSFSGNRRYLI